MATQNIYKYAIFQVPSEVYPFNTSINLVIAMNNQWSIVIKEMFEK